MYREDNIEKARIVKEKLLDDGWWDSVDYILRFTEPIYSMLRICDTDKPCLHLVYGMWDTMIVKVKRVIFEHEMKSDLEESSFWNVVCNVLEDRWSKSNTQLHCLAHSLNPRCITEDWIKEHPYLQTPNHDADIVKMTKNCIKRLFPDAETRTAVTLEFANFFGCFEEFGDEDSIRDRLKLDPLKWWVAYGIGAPHLRPLAVRLLGQVSSSSCCERNWSTYSFIHSTKRNRITVERAEDLVYVHSNLRLLSRRAPQYMKGESQMWDVAGDAFDAMDDIGILGIANLSLDEPELESILFCDDGEGEGPSNS
ncbi:uncharacterized protein LOC131015682 [Salvia miltiorrhiza]|uniref:uncharacterized protein LOC131015682 n=1 Tax=Salvia miltiorrhiza TaxID=226208 RepID=UPI0025AD3934|nr:uncharacterized protein LOC131015682 [Salvia miltiorrhiza]